MKNAELIRDVVRESHLNREDQVLLIEQFNAFIAERQWQPIEEAPMNGSCFLAYTDHSLQPSRVCFWESGIDFNGWSVYPLTPTHWMPLPEPPEVEG